MNKNVHKPVLSKLPKREQEVMEIIYRLERGSVSDVQSALADQPTYAAARMLLQRLHKKGLLKAERDGNRYIYSATTTKASAGRSALRRLIGTFFGGSKTAAVSALLGDDDVSDRELSELEDLVRQARKRQRVAQTRVDDR
ncbi:MAG: BlaI/MecI/CopY family transcriptional regulator [Pseudomonadales bacterium]